MKKWRIVVIPGPVFLVHSPQGEPIRCAWSIPEAMHQILDILTERYKK